MLVPVPAVVVPAVGPMLLVLLAVLVRVVRVVAPVALLALHLGVVLTQTKFNLDQLP